MRTLLKQIRQECKAIDTTNTYEVNLSLRNIIKAIDKELKKKPNYEKAYNILMDYWDYLPDEDKPKISKELKKVGC